jgi:hypothetical protein
VRGPCEFERALIAERIKAGLARVPAKGTRSGDPIGRPRVNVAKERRRIRERCRTPAPSRERRCWQGGRGAAIVTASPSFTPTTRASTAHDAAPRRGDDESGERGSHDRLLRCARRRRLRRDPRLRNGYCAARVSVDRGGRPLQRLDWVGSPSRARTYDLRINSRISTVPLQQLAIAYD